MTGGGKALAGLYAIVALVRAANAVFIVSLTTTFPGISAWLQGAVMASYSLVEAFSAVLAGLAYEYLGPRRLMALATLLLAGCYASMNLVRDPVELAIPNSVAGLSAAMILVASLSAVAEETSGYTSRRRIFGVGGFEASNLVGYAAGFAVAGALEILGELRGFTAPAAMAAASLVVSALLRGSSTARPGPASLWRLIDRRAMALVPAWLGLAMVLGVGFLSPKLLKELGLGIAVPGVHGNVEGPTSYGAALILALAGVAGGVVVGSLIASAIGKERALVLGSVCMPLAIAAVGLTHMEIAAYLPLVALLAAPALALPPTLLAFLAEFTDATRVRGPPSGIYITALGVGIALGSSIGGWIFDRAGLEALTMFLAIAYSILSAASLALLAPILAPRIRGR